MSTQPPEDSPETEHLLGTIAKGDWQAWEQLLAIHEPYLQRVLAHRLDERIRARVDLADILQDTYMQAAKRMVDFMDRRPMPFRLWLRKTACECLLHARRKHVDAQVRSVTREAPLPSRSSVVLCDQLVNNTTTASGKFVRQEIGQHVREAVANLTEQDREILILRTYEGLSNAEAACVLEIAADASRKRYTRALLRLRDELSERGLADSQIG